MFQPWHHGITNCPALWRDELLFWRSLKIDQQEEQRHHAIEARSTSLRKRIAQ
jgi:hypothetical protein